MNISLATRPHLKVLHYLFLPLLLVVASLCTQNTSAFSFPNGWVVGYSTSGPYWRMLVNGTTWSNWSINNFVNVPGNDGWVTVNGFELRNTQQQQFTIPAQSIYAVQIYHKANCRLNGYMPGTDYSWAHLLGIEIDNTNEYGNAKDRELDTFYFYNSGNAQIPNPMNLGINYNCEDTVANRWMYVSDIVFFQRETGGGGGSSYDYTDALEDILDAVQDLNTTYSSLETQIVALNYKMQQQTQTIQQQTQTIQQQYEQPRTEGQQAQTSGNSSATSSSADATSTGSTLLSGLTSLVAALNVNPAANCTIDMDLGNVDFGEADLCSISPPVQFQIISSLVVIGFAVPLSLAAAHKMVEMFRSFA